MSSTRRAGLLSGLALYLCSAATVAQSPAPAAPHPEEGRPFIHNYSADEMGVGGQNWMFLQDARGILYFGATGGIAQFDGSSWRLIDTEAQTVRSLAQDASGRIYVGGVANLGYLTVNAVGELTFVSLRDQLPPDHRTFTDVWRTYVTPQGVYFQTQFALFRWADGKMRVWKPADRFGRASNVNGRLIIPQPGIGLTEMINDELRPLTGTARFGNEVYPVLLPHDNGQLLVGTRGDGFFLYDGSAAQPFPTEIDDLIKKGTLYRGTLLPNGSIALALTAGGVALMDHQGRRLQVLNETEGLSTDQTYYVDVDRSGALWVATQVGVSRVDIASPASFFDGRDGLPSGGFNDIIRFEDRLLGATNRGVVVLHPATVTSPARFTFVSGINNQTWKFLVTPDRPGRPPQLLAAGSDGLFRIVGETATALQPSIAGSFNNAFLAQFPDDPDRIWAALFNGLTTLRWTGGTWTDEGRFDFTDQVRTLVALPNAGVWAGTSTSGLIRLTLDPTDGPRLRKAKIERFGKSQGLPDGGVFVTSIHGEPIFGNGAFNARNFNLFRFNASSRTFMPDHAFDVVQFRRFGNGYGPKEHADGRIFLNTGFDTAIMRRRSDGGYDVDTHTLSRFNDLGGIGPDFEDADGIIWFGATGQLLRFDPRRQRDEATTLHALVRRVTVNDALIYAGDAPNPLAPTLAPNSHSVRFEFAAGTFGHEAATQFQSRLEGLDSDWSAWTKESRRDYTNLGLGNYVLHLRARDYSGKTSADTTYAFTILPPWYRTWWAYGLGILGLVGLGFGVDRFQRRRLVGKERERAQIAEARLRAENAEALAQSEREGKRSIETLSEIGREITASLDFETIFDRLYDRVNQLADAEVFGVGLYHADRKEIEYRLAIEHGTRYAPYTRDASDRDQFPVWCIEHREPVVINDVSHEYSKYLTRFDEQSRTLEDGTMSRQPQSLIYLPLISKDRVLGIITIQSFEKNAYTDYDVNVMRSLAAYTSIALDNAAAYRQMNEQEHEIRRLFEEAERARAIAEEADAAKSSFLSTVSHELRTPLTSVLGFAKIIKKRLEERIFPLITTDDRRIVQTMQQVEENLKVVVSEGERLTKLIDDVLDLAKIEAGKLEWHMEPVTIADVIDRATAATASLFEQKGLALVKDVVADLPALTGDRDRLIQVVINLISNAVKFTETGSVTCRAVRRGSEIVVSVVDTGIGIAPVDQPKVFERFKQVGDTLTDKPKGTGLGLPICKEIVEHHGGRVWVESDAGMGSTFSFALPIAGEAAGAPVELAALIRRLRDQVVVTAPHGAERPPRILVVDDEAHIRELLTQEFTEAGYHVSTAINGRDGINAVRRERPDLIVLDVMMPEMNGFDVAAVLKNDPATLDIPIVILSIVQDRDRGFRLGVDRYLTKPIDTDLLFKEVGTLLEQKTSRKRVLVVDEDASTVKILTDVLRARGYSVSEAREADLVERAKSVQPDIIMLNSVSSTKPEVVQMLRFEKGLENVLFLVYQ